ncbi:MAG: hypothetical protein KKE05_00175, partial [Nanoarchaeota archaeon]|nr:hypothetical protein [Nanoarchaeota archaeon]
TQSIVDIEPAITGTSTYLLPTLAKRIVPVRDRIDLSRYGSMSEKERKEISDFVKFRYESRIEECPFGEYDRYDIIRDLAKGIEVPIGEGHKYLSGNVIRFILQ